MSKEFRDNKSMYMIGLVLFSFLTMYFTTRGDKTLPVVFGILFVIVLILFMIVNYRLKHPEVILKPKSKNKENKSSKKVIYKKNLSKFNKEIHHLDLVSHMRK